MYKSLSEIEKRLTQVRYTYKQVGKFKGRVFVKGGLDEETGAYPLLVFFSAFIAQARSVFQCAYKEAKQAGLLSSYNSFLVTSPIVGFFKKIRDNDIHEYAPSTRVLLQAESPIKSVDPQTGRRVGKEVTLYVESLSDIDFPKATNHDFTITITLGKRLDLTHTLICTLEAEGKHDLVESARNGEDLFETQECEGESDIFKLCENYLSEVERFVEFGKNAGFIT